MPQRKAKDEQVITTEGVLKWGGVFVGVITTIISIVWFAANVKADVAAVTEQQQVAERQTSQRNAEQEGKNAELTDRLDQTEKALNEMARKLDVAVTILQRIDQRSGRP